MKRLISTVICAVLLAAPYVHAEGFKDLVKSDNPSVKLIGFVDSNKGKLANDSLIKNMLMLEDIYSPSDVEYKVFDVGSREVYKKQCHNKLEFVRITHKEAKDLKIIAFPSIVIVSPDEVEETIIGYIVFDSLETKVVNLLNEREKNKKKSIKNLVSKEAKGNIENVKSLRNSNDNYIEEITVYRTLSQKKLDKRNADIAKRKAALKEMSKRYGVKEAK